MCIEQCKVLAVHLYDGLCRAKQHTQVTALLLLDFSLPKPCHPKNPSHVEMRAGHDDAVRHAPYAAWGKVDHKLVGRVLAELALTD